MTAVTLGTDFGNTVAGHRAVCSADDRIILNPADSLADGDVVTLSAQNAGRLAMRSAMRAMRRRAGLIGAARRSARPDPTITGPRPRCRRRGSLQNRGTKPRRAMPSSKAIGGNYFRIADLNPLVEQALVSNQNLRVAAARLEQARDQLTVARSDLFPAVGLSASALRAKDSANRPLSPSIQSRTSRPCKMIFVLGPAVTYEVDLFGRVRRDVEGARAAARAGRGGFRKHAAGADGHARDRLLFLARDSTRKSRCVRRSLDLQRGALSFVSSRHDLGFATGLDLAQQQALLESSATQLELLQGSAHAIRTCDRHAGRHARAQLQLAPALPTRAAAGVSRGTALGSFAAPPRCGFRGAGHGRGQCAHRCRARRVLSDASSWRPASASRMPAGRATRWPPCSRRRAGCGRSGLSATQTLFDAGKTRANVRFADADYTAAVATYRQTVLTAMEEVENGITGLASLDRAGDPGRRQRAQRAAGI